QPVVLRHVSDPARFDGDVDAVLVVGEDALAERHAGVVAAERAEQRLQERRLAGAVRTDDDERARGRERDVEHQLADRGADAGAELRAHRGGSAATRAPRTTILTASSSASATTTSTTDSACAARRSLSSAL